MDIHTYVYSSGTNAINTLNHTIHTKPIPFHSQHLQPRNIYHINCTSTLSLLILKELLSFTTIAILLGFSPKHSPTQPNDPNTISVRFGRSIHHSMNVRITGN